MCAQSSKSKETAIERLVTTSVKRRKNEEQAKAATELTKDHARNMSAPPPRRIDLAPLSKAMSTLRAAGRSLEDCGNSEESTIDGFSSTNVEHVMGDIQTIVHHLKERGQLQYKEMVGSNSNVDRLTKDVETWRSRFTDCKGDLNNALADLKESNSSLSIAEADRDTYKGLYEKLQQREATLIEEKNSWKAVSDEAARRREEKFSTHMQRQINELQSSLDTTRKREAELEDYQRDSQIKLMRMELTNKRQSDGIRDLERSEDQLRKHHWRLWEDVGSLRAELNAVPAELSKHAMTVADFQQQIEELTADGERDATEILLLQGDIADKAHAIGKMAKIEARQTNGLRRAKKELRRVKQDKKQVDSLLRGTHIDLSTVTRSKDQAEIVASDLSQETDELKKKLTKSQGDLTKSTTLISNLESQLEQSNETTREQAADLQHTREGLEEQDGKVTQANMETAQLSSRVDSLNGQLVVMHDSLNQSQTEAVRLMNNPGLDLRSMLKSRDEEIAELKGTIDNSQAALAERDAQMSILHNKITTLATRVEDRDKNVSNLQKETTRLLATVAKRDDCIFLLSQLSETTSTLERQVQDRDALAEFLSSWPQSGQILRCFVEHDDKEVRLMIRIDQDAGELHCLFLYADHTCEVQRHQVIDCLLLIRKWQPYLQLGRTGPLVSVVDRDGWNWLNGEFRTRSSAAQ